MASEELSYYYGYEAEQFSFYRIPKLLFTDSRFAGISTDARLLYGILLDRMSLSMKNGWHDDQGRVYIIFTLDDVAETLGFKTEKAIKLFHELDSKKGVGLIERVRQGQGRASLICPGKVKKFFWLTQMPRVISPSFLVGSSRMN